MESQVSSNKQDPRQTAALLYSKLINAPNLESYERSVLMAFAPEDWAEIVRSAREFDQSRQPAIPDPLMTRVEAERVLSESAPDLEDPQGSSDYSPR